MLGPPDRGGSGKRRSSLNTLAEPAFAQEILNIAQPQRVKDVEHYRQAVDLRAGCEVPKGGALCHPVRLRGSCRSHAKFF